MTMTVLDRAVAAGDAGQVSGERQQRPDPEVPEKARRRTFTVQYKQEVLAAYEAAASGEKGAILRREGLYSSLITEWRRARDAGALSAPARPPGSRSAGRADRPAAERESPAGAGAGQGPLRGRRAVKTAGALGDDLRGRGHGARVEVVTDEAVALLAPRIGTRAACRAAGVAQATWYRRHRISAPTPKPAPVPHAERVQPRALAPAERQAILDALHSTRFADLAPDEVWATLLDEGAYLGSVSTY